MIDPAASGPMSWVNRGTLMILPGRLEGASREDKCLVLANRVHDAYDDCSIVSAPNDLPDGDYIVSFDGHHFTAAKTRGLWLSCGPARAAR